MARPKFSRNRKTLDARVLSALASHAIDDARLLLTVESVSYHLQLSEVTVRTLIKSGDLPAIYLPEAWGTEIRIVPRIPCEMLLEWLRSKYPPSAA